MPHYYFLTLLAVVLQIFRHLEQKKLVDHFDKSTITLMRFLLPLPFAVVYLIIFKHFLDWRFLLMSAVVSSLQISGGILLLKSLSKQNFANSMALAHTELLFASILGVCFFKQKFTLLMFVAIIVILLAVFLISNFKFKSKNINKASFFATFSGFIFACQAFLMKETSMYFIKINAGGNNFISALTLFFAVHLFHNIFLITHKITQKKLFTEVKKILQYESGLSFIKIGVISSICTALWYYVYTAGEVVMVKAISQLEVLLAIIVSHFILKEKFILKEVLGIVLLLAGLFLLIYLKEII